MYSGKKEEFKPVETIEIVSAIENLINLLIQKNNDDNKGYFINQAMFDEIEVQKRIIVDGLRFHSGAQGIVTGDSDDE